MPDTTTSVKTVGYPLRTQTSRSLTLEDLAQQQNQWDGHVQPWSNGNAAFTLTVSNPEPTMVTSYFNAADVTAN